jgi:hypothetical protein
MGHLDVVTKLVELGAEWPHGKGVDEEIDVVTQLVENYKGPRRMQVSWRGSFAGRGQGGSAHALPSSALEPSMAAQVWTVA